MLFGFGRRRQESRRPYANRAVAVTRILDEADIVEAFVRHTAAYAAHHVFLDNGSRDGTLDILHALKDEGLSLTVLRNSSASFNEAHSNTSLFMHAAREHGADWVLHLDTDEFIDDRGLAGGLMGYLASAHSAHAGQVALSVPSTQYYATASDDKAEIVVPARMIKRLQPAGIVKMFVNGRLADRNILIAAGNHAAFVNGTPVPSIVVPGLTLAHYCDRSPAPRAVRGITGWAKVLAAGPAEVARGASAHYKAGFEHIRDRPREVLDSDYWHQRTADHPGLVVDPIDYRGGPLRYTGSRDPDMEAVRSLMGYLECLARQHGRLMDECPEALALVQAWNAEITRVL